jgi:hypothetical protein
VDRNYWTTTKTMWKPELGHIWLAILNPTNTTTQAYLEDQGGGWRVFSLSCLDHPNIRAELAGAKPLIPAAVSLAQVHVWFADWCIAITEAEKEATDVEWPPHSGRWFRPGAEFEARCLGRWPSQGTYGVWSDSLWQACTRQEGQPKVHAMPIDEPPQIGCDVARFGDDNTAIHVRWGDTSLHHEEANGWRITQTVGRLIELARQFADHVNGLREQTGYQPMLKAEEIPIKVDDEGGDLGAGVTDLLMEHGFHVVSVCSSRASMWPDRYPNKRSELWFSTASRAKQGMLALGQLDPETLSKLKSQAMAPQWALDSAGRRVVEPKDKTKGKIGRSPDSMDALNLAYYEGAIQNVPTYLPAPPRPKMFSEQWSEQRKRKGGRRLFGR